MIPGVIIKESDESKQDLVDRLVDAYNNSEFTAVNEDSIAGMRSQKSYILYLCKTYFHMITHFLRKIPNLIVKITVHPL